MDEEMETNSLVAPLCKGEYSTEMKGGLEGMTYSNYRVLIVDDFAFSIKVFIWVQVITYMLKQM